MTDGVLATSVHRSGLQRPVQSFSTNWDQFCGTRACIAAVEADPSTVQYMVDTFAARRENGGLDE